MVKLSREMPLIGKAIEHTGLHIKPIHQGVVVVQQSDCVVGLPLKLPKFGTVLNLDSEVILSAIPNHCMLFSDLEIVKKIMDDYSNQIGEVNITVMDMSDQYITLDISKKYARALLAKGCELDLSTDIFKVNQCARTLLALVNVVIWREADDNFKLIVDVSLAPHLWLWLQGAASEYSE